MRNPLLDRSTPRELAVNGQIIEQQEKLGVFPRLTEVLAKDLSSLERKDVPRQWRQAPVAIKLSFGWGDSRQTIPALEGGVRTRIPAVCQRCLGPLQVALEVDLKLMLAAPGRNVAETEGYEIWELEESDLRPLDILDEALIMAMPLSALHASDEICAPPADIGPSPDSEDTIRPFADLRSQMRDND
ncbi:MAG: DUF177 domain-containing protein [Woeseia sp.]